MIFKSNHAALDKTIRKLADVEANIASLQAKRAELLAAPDADNVSEIEQVGRSIEAERAAAEIYRDKIKALKNEVRREKYHEREKQRAAAIERISKKFAKREQIAEELEKAIERASQLYFEMTELLDLQSDWQFAPPSQPDLFRLDLKKIKKAGPQCRCRIICT